jgi:hypothetical protein
VSYIHSQVIGRDTQLHSLVSDACVGRSGSARKVSEEVIEGVIFLDYKDNVA